MDTATVAQLFISLSSLDAVLHGAASGALIASLVLCRARMRRLQVQAWAVTAAWSTLGAGIAVVYILGRLLV